MKYFCELTNWLCIQSCRIRTFYWIVHLSYCLSLVSRSQYALSSSLWNCRVQFKSQTFAKGNPLNLEPDEIWPIKFWEWPTCSDWLASNWKQLMIEFWSISCTYNNEHSLVSLVYHCDLRYYPVGCNAGRSKMKNDTSKNYWVILAYSS